MEGRAENFHSVHLYRLLLQGKNRIMFYQATSMFLQQSNSEKTSPGLNFTRPVLYLPMGGIDSECPLPLLIASRNLCGWGIKGYYKIYRSHCKPMNCIRYVM